MQIGAPADRQGSLNSFIQNFNDCQYLTITYTSANSLCGVVWLGGVDHGVWSAGPCGQLCGSLWAALWGVGMGFGIGGPCYQEYYVYSLETNTIFLTQLQNLEHM